MNIQILEATYGLDGNEVDVKQLIIDKYLKNNRLHFGIGNETMGGDPVVGYEKRLKLKFIWNDTEYNFEEPEGALIDFPENKYNSENCLVITSCNRVEQICLAIAVNKEIIKDNFNIVIADGSTPHLNANEAVFMHNSDDPYNSIKMENYNSDYELFEQYIKTIPKIKKYTIIHASPRLDKQTGEASLTSHGLLAAANLGSKYAVKLTGVCNLKYDVFKNIEQRMGENGIMTWKRSGFNQRSTRVFAVRPDIYMSMLSKESYYGWMRCYDFIERRLDKLNKINESVVNPIDLPLDERDIIVDEGLPRTKEDHRFVLTENLKKHNLLNSSDPWIRKFLDGHIW